MYGQLPEIKRTDGTAINAYPCQILNPPKIALLRLPTSAELTTFMSSQRTIVTDLGRGKSRSEDAPMPASYARLFKAIRLDADGPEFDEAEIRRAVGIITRHRMLSCVRDGETYVVKIATLLDDEDEATGERIPTVHTVSIPLERDADEFRRTNFIATDLPDNRQEQRFPVEAAVRLYDKIFITVTGYDDDSESGDKNFVPPHHKKTVVLNVLSALASLDPALDPN